MPERDLDMQMLDDAVQGGVPDGASDVSQADFERLREALAAEDGDNLEEEESDRDLVREMSTREVDQPPVDPSLRASRNRSHAVAIDFNNVVKEYTLYKNDIHRLLGSLTGHKRGQVVRASDHLSFSIERGESVAFLGDNGAGKTTLLKLISGVAHPESGQVKVNGRVSALLELTAGFDENLTGYENIDLRCLLWGLTDEEVKRIKPDIIEFADLGMYMEQPLRTFSSGMRARLGFAVASSINPDILIVDEALSVGDKYFAQKCLKRVEELTQRNDITVLFVTHSLKQAREFCRRGIVLKKGRLVFDGHVGDAIRYYEQEYDK